MFHDGTTVLTPTKTLTLQGGTNISSFMNPFLSLTVDQNTELTPIRSWTKNSGDGRRGPSSCATNMKNTQLRAKDPKLIVQNFSASCGWYPYTLRSMWFVIATNYFIRSTNTALPSKCTMVPIFPFVNKLVFVTGVGLLDTLFPHRCALRVGHQMSNVSMLSYFKKDSKHHSNESNHWIREPLSCFPSFIGICKLEEWIRDARVKPRYSSTVWLMSTPKRSCGLGDWC